jgi:hypothetical protein
MNKDNTRALLVHQEAAYSGMYLPDNNLVVGEVLLATMIKNISASDFEEGGLLLLSTR